MDAEAKAAAIAAMMQENGIEFRFSGGGVSLADGGWLRWSWVEVEAMDPTLEKWVKLRSFPAASKFLLMVVKKCK